MVVEVSGATHDQVQKDLGQAFTEFCDKHKGAGIIASVVKDSVSDQIIKFINEE